MTGIIQRLARAVCVSTLLVSVAETQEAPPPRDPTTQISIRRDQLTPALRAQVDSGHAKVLGARGDATAMTVAPAPSTSGANTPAQLVQVPRGSLVLARTDSVGRQLGGATRDRLLASANKDVPTGAVVTDIPIEIASPQGTNGGVQVWRPYVVHPERLGYNPDVTKFVGDVLVGLRNASGSASRIAGTVGLSLVTDARVDPTSIAFSENDTDPKRVRVEALLGSSTVVLRVHPNGAPDADVRVELPLPTVLRFENPPTRVQGLGLERRRVILSVAGAPLTAPITVTFGAGNADVTPKSATIEPGGTAEVTVIADALGDFQLTASSGSAFGAQTTLTSQPPIRFIVAILLGALIGALYWHFFRKPRRGTARRRFALSLLCGVIAAAVWLGLEINYTILPVGGVVYSTAAVLAFAAVGGLGGSTLGDKIGAKPAAGGGKGGES